MSDTETPEQWAARLIDAYILAATRAESEMCDPSGKCGVKMRAIIAAGLT